MLYTQLYRQRNLGKAYLAALDETIIGKETLCYALGEVLLAHGDVMKNADEILKQNIASYSYEILENKEADRTHHGLATISTSAYLCASALFAEQKQRSAIDPLKTLLITGMIQDELQLHNLKEIYRSLIQK